MKVVKVDCQKLWLSNKEAAKYLGVSKDWLRDRRESGVLIELSLLWDYYTIYGSFLCFLNNLKPFRIYKYT